MRSENGITLMETMVAVTVGSILLLGIYSSVMGMYTATSTNENQVEANNMAQQVIDNSRNMTYKNLRDLAGGVNGSGPRTADCPLYTYGGAFFPRPLLRDETGHAGQYSQASMNKRFNGSVTETIENLTPGEEDNGLIKVTVDINWTDSRGPHRYTNGTTIAQTGIHN